MSESAAKAAKKELEQVISHSNEVLCTATTVFPMTMFPDTITVDRSQLTITNRSFFRNAEIMSIRLEDILNVTANVGPFFGSLQVFSRIMNLEKSYRIKFLWRDDALKMKKFMQGYTIAIEKDINLEELTIDELKRMLTELGNDEHSGK